MTTELLDTAPETGGQVVVGAMIDRELYMIWPGMPS